MGFVAALITLFGSVLLYAKVQQWSLEVAVGCLSVAIASLLVAIIVAPWQIQLLLLLGVLLFPALVNNELFH